MATIFPPFSMGDYELVNHFLIRRGLLKLLQRHIYKNSPAPFNWDKFKTIASLRLRIEKAP